MSALLITNAQLLDPLEGNVGREILILQGRVAAIDPQSDQVPTECDRVDAQGNLLTPGLVDIHTHGIQEFLYERDPDELVTGTAQLGQYGTTCVLPTLYQVLQRDSLRSIEFLSKALSQITTVDVPGFHFEGPFLSLPGAGAKTLPGDLVFLNELLASAEGQVRAMSVSPDCENILPVIEALCEQGIAVFITHTQASVEQTKAAIDAGARHATHFCNVFPPPPETEPGVKSVGAYEAVMVDPRCTVDFICDGVHVDPILIHLALQTKGLQAVSAISDSNIGAGSEGGLFDTPWGYSVRTSRDNAVRVADVDHPLHGVLAGSSLTLDRATSNLTDWLELSMCEAFALSSCNPARVVGLPNKGTLRPGADADLVLWNTQSHHLQAMQTWVKGVSVFDAASVVQA